MKLHDNISMTGLLMGLIFGIAAFSSCKKDGNPHNLPAVSPDDYLGTIDGYHASNEVAEKHLVAYWNFDGNDTEQKSGSTPTQKTGDSYVNNGITGQALSLTNGYLYYTQPFDAFRTDAFRSFTISLWVQILNNGSKKTMLFQLTRPGVYYGNINFELETNLYPATETEKLVVHPRFTAVNGGTQDNVNANWLATFRSPEIGADKWTHLVLTYERTTGVFNIWADGEKIGDYPNRGTTNLFNSFEPNEVIIGGNYNGIPGKEVNTNVEVAPMTGRIDELRIYNIALTDAHISALYKLGLELK